MKKVAIIPVITLLFLMLASCIPFPDPPQSSSIGKLGEGTFYAQNIVSKSFYTVNAEMLWEGNKCKIWAEKGSGVTKEQAEDVAREYDSSIRPKIINTFSRKNFTYEGKAFNDILDFANWCVGRSDKKITILLLDIKDGYVKGKNNAYVAGYFNAVNFLEEGRHLISGVPYYSNGRDMIYIDTNPGLQSQPEQVLATFAHELQHLVNFITCFFLGKGYTDIWVNEGLSAYAEYLYLGKHPDDKCGWLSNGQNTINTGNNFFVWDNHKVDGNNYANIDDYATVYLFFQWLYLQAESDSKGKGADIFRNIAYSQYHDYRAVVDEMRKIDPVLNNWETLLKKWLAAYYDPENGYTGDTELLAILKSPDIKKIYPNEENAVLLYPGEGVYSIINGPYFPVSGTNIRYEELSGVSTLLTFNANTNNTYNDTEKVNPETGSLTGVSASVTVSPTAADKARSAGQAKTWNGPYVIDARDLLGRDQDKFNFRLPR